MSARIDGEADFSANEGPLGDLVGKGSLNTLTALITRAREGGQTDSMIFMGLRCNGWEYEEIRRAFTELDK